MIEHQSRATHRIPFLAYSKLRIFYTPAGGSSIFAPPSRRRLTIQAHEPFHSLRRVGSAILDPLSLVLDGLMSTGTGLAPGKSMRVSVELANPNDQSMAYTARVLSGIVL